VRSGSITPARRITRDLDFVGDFPFDVADTVRRFAPAVAVALQDDVVIEPGSLAAQGIWLDTAFPGVRLAVALGLGMIDDELTIDVGFNDPLVPAATTLVLGDVCVRACRPETQVGWKLHGLAERGASFRPKDLADLQLILRHVPLEAADLPPAIVAAFESRGYTIADALAVLDAPHWATKSARLRWEPYKTSLVDTVADVRGRLAPTFAALRDPR
jgi:hypothetical protein